MNNRKAFAEAQELHKAGRFKEAEQRYRKLLKKTPGNQEISFYLGMALLQTGRARDAVNPLETVARVAPKDPIAQDHLGQALLAAGEHEKAIERHMRARALAPNRPEIRFNLGVALERVERLNEAESEYRATIALAANFFPALANLGAVLHKAGRYAEAEPVLRQALRLNPAAPQPLATLVAVLEHTYRMDEADQLIDEFLRIAPDDPMGFLMNARKQERCGNTQSASDLYRQAATAPLEDRYRAAAWYELGKLQDRQGKYQEAFRSFGRMNEITESGHKARELDRDEMGRRITAYRAYPSDGWIAGHRAQQSDDMPPVTFFVGFPRSGTTLMEQILGAHPNVETTNEISPLIRTLHDIRTGSERELPEALGTLGDDRIESLRREFLENARNITGSDLNGLHLVDKSPLNIVELGPIQFLFPDARAIVALRDPRDACLSCFVQQFAMNQGMVHFLSLETTARFYCAVMELWLRYRKSLSIRWMEYRYEDLVADFEGTVSRVLDFLDLPWDDSVNRYAEHAKSRSIMTPSRVAVTQAIDDRAVSRWRNYAEQLAPFQDTLAPFVREFGYESS